VNQEVTANFVATGKAFMFGKGYSRSRARGHHSAARSRAGRICVRSRHQRTLRGSEERYRCIVENTHEGICMSDGHPNVTDRNSA
jgi:hypothetical protein